MVDMEAEYSQLVLQHAKMYSHHWLHHPHSLQEELGALSAAGW